MSRLPSTPEAGTEARPRTAIVTGASRGIGAGVTGPFIDLGYNVVANALHFADSTWVPNANLALVEGNIGQASTAVRVTETPISPLDYGRVMRVVDKWKPYGGLIYFICCWTHWIGPGISGGTPQEQR
jgi:NAD(P)-dependent dehydrogenase (short-subunit alcohol dehydrogenase family)